MIQKEIFSAFEGDNWYIRNKNGERCAKPDVLLGRKYAFGFIGGRILEIGSSNGEKLNSYTTYGLSL